MKRTKKNTARGSIALAAILSGAFAQPALSQEYHFVMPVSGAQAPPAEGPSWEDFAAANSLPNDGDWNDIDWDGLGITALPKSDYPVSSLSGYLRLHNNPLTDIDGLSNITYANRIYLQNTGLTDEVAAGGLTGLTDFQYGLFLQDNNLTHVDFLSNMTLSGPGLNLSNNNLTNIDGLSNITAHGGLNISNNNITDLEALSNTTTFTHDLVAFNNSLTTLNGLRNLETIDRGLWLAGNPLTSLDGLEKLTEIGYGLHLYNTTSLSDISALSSLTSVGDGIRAYNSAIISLNGLSGLTSLGDNLSLQNNADLVDLSGISNITTMGGFIRIDAGIAARPGFVPISSAAWLCQAGQSGMFDAGYATQSEACAL